METPIYFLSYSGAAFVIALISLLWGSHQKILGASLLLGSIILSNIALVLFGFIYPDITNLVYFYIAMDLVLAYAFLLIFKQSTWLIKNRWAGALAFIQLVMISNNFAGGLNTAYGKSGAHSAVLNGLVIIAFAACLVSFIPKSANERNILKMKLLYLKSDLFKRVMSRTEGNLPKNVESEDLVNAHIGQRVRQLRVNAEMTQEDLGAVLGVSPAQINRIENGAKRISGAQMFAVGKLFRVDMNYFTDGIERLLPPSGKPVPTR